MISENEKNAWILIRACINQGYRKVSLNKYIFDAVDILDKVFNIENDLTYKKLESEHVCGLQGFGRGFGSESDRCIACEIREKIND